MNPRPPPPRQVIAHLSEADVAKWKRQQAAMAKAPTVH